MRQALPDTTVFTHLEPREDPTSFVDQELDRTPLTDTLMGHANHF